MRFCSDVDFIARAVNSALFAAYGFYLADVKFCVTNFFIVIKFKAVLYVLIKFNEFWYKNVSKPSF